MMKLFKYIFFSSILVMLSCDSLTTTLDVEETDFVADQMVVSAIIGQGDYSADIHVGENRSFLEEGDYNEYNLPGASITITKEATGETIEPDMFVEDPQSSTENYRSEFLNDFFFVPGDYTFRVEHPDYPLSETTLALPGPEEIENIEFEYDGGIDVEGDETSTVTFDILDGPGADFYELQIYIDGQHIRLETIDPVGQRGYDYRTLLFSDETFEGERKRVEVNFSRYSWNETESEELRVVWYSVNEGYYLLSKAVRRQQDTRDNPFATAVQINNNVNDALGVIGLRSYNEYILNP